MRKSSQVLLTNNIPFIAIIIFLLGIFIGVLGNLYSKPVLLVSGLLIVVVVLGWSSTKWLERVVNRQHTKPADLAVMLVYTGLIALISVLSGILLYKPEQSPNSTNMIDLFISPSEWNQVYKTGENYSLQGQLDESQLVVPYPEQDRGIGYTLPLEPNVRLDYIVKFPERIEDMDVISADVFIPDDGRVSSHWVALQVIDLESEGNALTGGTVELGKWVRLVLDLRQQFNSQGIALSERPVSGQLVVGLTGAERVGTVTFGLDNVLAYRDVGDISVHIQPAPYQRIFDFENNDVAGWQIGVGRDGIDVITSSEEQYYRGNGALRLQTENVDANSVVSTKITLPELSPNGVWVAHLYVPESSTEFWMNFFTYLEESENEFADSETKRLKPGEWTTLIWDTRSTVWNTDSIVVGIQLGPVEGEYSGPIYIDDVYIFSDAPIK